MKSGWIAILLAALGLMACAGELRRPGETPLSIIVEAESFSAETGGALVKRAGRPATSGGVAVSAWDAQGHTVTWQVQVPKRAEYAVVLRYAGGRGWPVYRDLRIDGLALPSAFSRIALAPTGGFGVDAAQWRNLLVVDAAGQPARIALAAGTYQLRMSNLGGAGADGSANLDLIALVESGGDVSLASLPTASKVPAPVGSPPTAATPRSAGGGAVEHASLRPADLLALGKLRDWKLHLPVAGVGSEWAAEITQPELASLRRFPWFFVDSAGDAVVFRAHAGGARTSNNTRFARSELLEMATEYAGDRQVRYERKGWDLADQVERRMFLRQTITAVPLQKPQVVVGQIHNAKDDVLMVKFEGDAPGTRSNKGALQIRLNNAKVTHVIDPAYVLGTSFSVEIIARAGKISVLYNGQPTVVKDAPVTIDTRDCYWKAGMYVQSSNRNSAAYNNGFADEQADEYGEVKVHELRLSRS